MPSPQVESQMREWGVRADIRPARCLAMAGALICWLPGSRRNGSKSFPILALQRSRRLCSWAASRASSGGKTLRRWPRHLTASQSGDSWPRASSIFDPNRSLCIVGPARDPLGVRLGACLGIVGVVHLTGASEHYGGSLLTPKFPVGGFGEGKQVASETADLLNTITRTQHQPAAGLYPMSLPARAPMVCARQTWEG